MGSGSVERAATRVQHARLKGAHDAVGAHARQSDAGLRDSRLERALGCILANGKKNGSAPADAAAKAAGIFTGGSTPRSSPDPDGTLAPAGPFASPTAP